MTGPQELDGAARAFREGRFDDAAAAYRAALAADAGDRAGASWFNLGRCAEETGDLAAAYWRYRCAALRLPEDAAVRARTERAAERLGVAPPSAAYGGEPSDAWRLGGAVALLVAGLRLAFRAERRAVKAAATLMVLAGLAAATPVWRRAVEGTRTIAVVTASEAVCQATPQDRAPVLFRVGPGEELRVLETSDTWSRVEHARGTGWMRRAALGFVE